MHLSRSGVWAEPEEPEVMHTSSRWKSGRAGQASRALQSFTCTFTLFRNGPLGDSPANSELNQCSEMLLCVWAVCKLRSSTDLSKG